MKLPQYDNRPQPGESLHSDPKARDHDWDVIKGGVGLFIVLPICLGLFAYGVFTGLAALFH